MLFKIIFPLAILTLTLQLARSDKPDEKRGRTTVPGFPRGILCGINEIKIPNYTPCSDRSCDRKENHMMCPTRPGYGCICAVGFRRDHNRVCIPEIQCPLNNTIIICEDNQAAIQKYSECLDRFCDHRETFTSCSIGTQLGCVCIEGYNRDNDGVCIPEKNCPSKTVCGDKQVAIRNYSDCSDRFCDHRETFTTCTIGTEVGCVCIEGYMRDNDGVCIPEKNCPSKIVCEDKQVAIPYYSICSDRFCDHRETFTTCTIGTQFGCVCIEGYRRDNVGVCVPEKKCPSKTVCGDKQVAIQNYSTCSDRFCDYRETFTTCTIGSTQLGCVCIKGYKRDNDGVCIPESQCPSKIVCRDKQVAVQNYTPCSDNYCDYRETFMTCLRGEGLGCVCIEGYRRDNYGVCIPEGNCLLKTVCRANEYAVPNYNACSDKYCNYQEMYMKCGPSHVPGCACIPGFRRHNGVCIPEAQCLSKMVCLANEVAVSNYNACTDHYCNYQETFIKCASSQAPGCACIPRFRRNHGVCIPEAQCPSKIVCPFNEVKLEKYTPCNDRYCDFKEILIDCPKPVEPGCACADNFKRNEQGVCIPVSQCPPYRRSIGK